MSKYRDDFIAFIPELGAYMAQWPEVLHHAEWVLGSRMTPEAFAGLTDYQIGGFCSDLWEGLPDNNSIRHGAFFALCDFCSECPGDEPEDA